MDRDRVDDRRPDPSASSVGRILRPTPGTTAPVPRPRGECPQTHVDGPCRLPRRRGAVVAPGMSGAHTRKPRRSCAWLKQSQNVAQHSARRNNELPILDPTAAEKRKTTTEKQPNAERRTRTAFNRFRRKADRRADRREGTQGTSATALLRQFRDRPPPAPVRVLLDVRLLTRGAAIAEKNRVTFFENFLSRAF